jgi:hypothetical protein
MCSGQRKAFVLLLLLPLLLLTMVVATSGREPEEMSLEDFAGQEGRLRHPKEQHEFFHDTWHDLLQEQCSQKAMGPCRARLTNEAFQLAFACPGMSDPLPLHTAWQGVSRYVFSDPGEPFTPHFNELSEIEWMEFVSRDAILEQANIFEQLLEQPGVAEAYGNLEFSRANPLGHLARLYRQSETAGDTPTVSHPDDMRAWRWLHDQYTAAPALPDFFAPCRAARDQPCQCTDLVICHAGRIVALQLVRVPGQSLWLRNDTLAGMDALEVLLAGGIDGMQAGALHTLVGLRALVLHLANDGNIGPGFASLRSLESLFIQHRRPDLLEEPLVSQEAVVNLPTTNHSGLPGAVDRLGDFQGLCSLHNLRVLQLIGFSGSLPSCLGELQELTDLYLSGNHFHALPPEVGHLPKLRVLVAFQNGASSCPREADECHLLYKVKYDHALAPGENYKCRSSSLSGPIPEEYRHLHQLEKFWVDGNFLNGTIPDWMGSAWPKLRSLDLFDNELTGTIPASLGQLKQLELLQLQENRYVGPWQGSSLHSV